MNLLVFFVLLLGALSGAARADTLDWATRPLTNINGASDVATVNGVAITTTGSTAGAFTANQIQIQPAGTSNGTTGFIFSSMNAATDNETARQTVTIVFSEPVYNVSFTVWDLDGGPAFNDGTNFFNDILTFTSSGGVPTTGTPGSQVTWTPATGRAAATANAGLANANGNITVTFAGPVTSVTINHVAGAVTGSNNPTQQAVLIEDITFFKRPQLTLMKAVTNDNGGTNVDTDFTLTATGPTTISGTEGQAAVTNAVVNPGTYVLTESGAATAAYTQGTWTCTAGTLTGNSLALSAGQIASCTITNNDRPRLTLLKTVINNSGGAALDTAFTLTATGPVTISGVEGNAAVTNANVNAGTYALSESSVAGYTGGAWSCVGGALTGSSLVLAQNQNATCTVTNDDQPAALTLSKTIDNTGGGTAVLADFPLTATGPTNVSGISGTAPVTGAMVNAGTYALSEVTNSNYTASIWTCSGGSLSGGSLTLALGETASCSITNTFVPAPALTIQKTADTAGPLIVGQTVNYSYLVENTGNVTITGVNVAETAFNGSGAAPSPVASGPTTIAPGQTVSFTAFYIVTQQDVDTLQ